MVDTAFLVGADLVTFDRRDLPIYATPKSLWADAGHDATTYGASVDRLFGEADATFVAGVPLIEEPREIAAGIADPLVTLSPLNDGLILPGCEHQPGLDQPPHGVHALAMSPVYDFASDSHAILPIHHGLGLDLAKPEWFYDHHT
jgi:hypothetical protein